MIIRTLAVPFVTAILAFGGAPQAQSTAAKPPARARRARPAAASPGKDDRAALPALATASAADLASGKHIFDAQCAWCHGEAGTGGNGPNLQRTSLRHAATDRALVDLIRTGIPGAEMPAFALSLTEHMTWQTAAYVRSLGRIPQQPLPGDPARGADVFASNGCGGCHTVNGAGGIIGPDLTAIGALRGPSYLREALVNPGAKHPPGYLVARASLTSGGDVRGILVNEDAFWILLRDARGDVHTLAKADVSRVEREPEASLMPSYAKRLSPADLDDLVAYLATLRGER